MMPIEAFMDNRLTKTDLRVLGAILSWRDKKTNQCWPKRAQISDRCRLPLCKISTSTTRLVTLGWLKKEGDGGRCRSAKYELTIPILESKTLTDSVTKTVTDSVTETLTDSVTVTKSETVTDSVTETLTDSVTKTVTDSVRGIKQTNEQTNEHKEEKEIVAKEVADYLCEKIKSRNPKTNAKSLCWISEIEKAMRIDGRSKNDLIEIIDWVYTDGEFWVSNILSGKKLREKYEQMYMQKISDRKSNKSSNPQKITRKPSQSFQENLQDDYIDAQCTRLPV